ncbi:hypothetical protein ANACOL_02837 [Anaerotruncus colihominis DSM 17241]|uniref:Uncharacterized protein n=1 Tax=Anaerotruncus colihominis DSM 17241 TaxID=445972 RepID=B0PE52_9FIRM|nr:hypothetical protein ANACOL_02837 [Anaerotruncus colihominis DSM 17241]
MDFGHGWNRKSLLFCKKRHTICRINHYRKIQKEGLAAIYQHGII